MKKPISIVLVAALLSSLCACGGSASSTESKTEQSATESVQQEVLIASTDEETPPEAAASSVEEANETDNDLIEFDNVVLADTDILTMELVNFYAKDVNWVDGTQNEKYFTVKVTNKSDDEFILDPDQLYLNDEQTFVTTESGSIDVAPGKSGTFSYLVAYNTMPEHTALGSLDELYGLEGTFDGMDSTTKAKLSISFSINDALGGTDTGDSAAQSAESKEEYSSVIQLLSDNIWCFNGGNDTTLNGISFTQDAATISQVVFDGNGIHDNGSTDYDYAIDDSNITVTLSDGGSLEIPYTCDGTSVKLGENEYYTLAEVDAAIQGCWTATSSLQGNETQKYILFDGNNVTSEKASESAFGAAGEYFYYGPYTGTYTLVFGGLDTDMSHGSEWYFNIIDGAVVLLNYGNVCTRADGLPGENGYSF